MGLFVLNKILLYFKVLNKEEAHKIEKEINIENEIKFSSQP